MMRGLRRMNIVLALAAGGLVPAPGLAGPIDPNAFASLGAFPTTTGNYTIDTSGTPTLTGPGGLTLSGVDFQDTPGHTVAVFAFSSINLARGETITATGSVPLVLLSRGDVTIGGTIDGNGTGAVGGPGGGGGIANPGPGAGSYIFEGGSGGGFGGAGGASGVYVFRNGTQPIPSLPGGRPYGDLSASLQGGSAGGSGAGAGGGGIEIGAVGTLSVLAGGVVAANGASEPIILGGGSGGGIFLHGDTVSIASGALISAQGGDGGNGITNGGPNGGTGGGGGGGGGGRILVEFSSFSSSDIFPGAFDFQGGAAGRGGAGTSSGGFGVVNFDILPVPEPSSLTMVAMAVVVGLGGHWHRRRRASRA